jgi:glucosamine--fructose-6-phosphate aminotransferase (isomerizing)
MTHFLSDILRQPEELKRTVALLAAASGGGRGALAEATAAILGARHVYLTGIGSSWHAALNAATMFHANAQPVDLQDAAELLAYAVFPANSVVIIISRSGRSIEIVQLAEKARAAGATIVGITNVADGPLAKLAHIPLVFPSPLDRAISVVTYTTLALAAGILAASVAGNFDASLAARLSASFDAAGKAIPGWQQQIADSTWPAPGATTYFLARGSSLGSAYETRLMWEEGVKSPATAMGSASFRHGPQEMVAAGQRFGIWLDGGKQREKDLALARDLRALGASVMLIGQNIPAAASVASHEAFGDLVLALPPIRPEWQFAIDIIPAQLAADRTAALHGVDCDTFRLCSFVVEDDGGLLGKSTGP